MQSELRVMRSSSLSFMLIMHLLYYVCSSKSIVLVYEYSIIYESNSKTSLKQTWLSLMNKSEEAIPFEAKLNKAKINLDPMYLHFLPLILKTLKKNKYFDKIIDDDSTQSPFSKEGTPENLYTKNIFSDSSNWMTMPTSRLFTIEYKTSPIVYFKYPTRNAEYFTKVRKVRDYQRIMNYVDKMISDRVGFTSTVPMIKSTFSLHKKLPRITYPSTTPMNKVQEHVTKKQSEFKKSEQRLDETSSYLNKWNCRCPKRMSRLLSKLVKSLQNLIPDITDNEQNISSCNENKLPETNKSPQKKEIEMKTKNQHSDETAHILAADLNNEIGGNILEINSKKISVPKTKTFEIPKIDLISTLNNDEPPIPNTISNTLYSVKPSYSNVESTLSSIIKIMKPSTIHNQQDYRTTTYTPTKKFIEATSTDYYSLEDITKPMLKVTPTSKVKNSFKMVRNFVSQKNVKKVSTKPLSLKTFSATEYEDYFTTPDILKSFKWLIVQNIEQAKDKKAANNNERTNQKGETEFNALKTRPNHEPFRFKEKGYNNTRNILTKIEKLAHSLKNQTHNKNDRLNNITNVEIVTGSEYKRQKMDCVHSQESMQSYLSANKSEQPQNPEDTTLEEEIYNENFDSVDIIAEDNLKVLENVINKINVSEIFNRTLKNENEKEKFVHDIENSSDSSYKNWRSMMPEDRPSYLEMQRNNWKRDDDNNHNVDDYDNNLFL